MPLNINSYLANNPPIHIIGGGGVGMSGLATLVKKLGFQVTVSDQNASKYLKQLQEYNITTWVGSQPQRIPKNAIIFHSTAIKDNDIEIQYVKEKNYHIFSRHPLLTFITKKFYTIAISGTHGKTTTTAWLAFLFECAGLNPSALIGGEVIQHNTNIIIGNDYNPWSHKPLLIIEADESDNSFLNINAEVGLITNVDMDHPDQHASIEDINNSFLIFIQKLCKEKKCFIPSLECYQKFKKFVSPEIQTLLEDISIIPQKQRLKLQTENKEIFVNIKGEYNLYNATCVYLLAKYFNFSNDAIKMALSQYKGVARRNQIILEQGFITIIDDYAHHPKEMQAVINSLQKDYKNIYVLWEPHRYSRFCYFHKEFYSVCENIINWNFTILLPIYSMGDDPLQFEYLDTYLGDIQKNVFIDLSYEFQDTFINNDTLQHLLNNISSQTAFVFMGAGNSSQWCHTFAQYIQTKLR